MFLLDTNVVSELVKAHPDERVQHWMRVVSEEETYLSVISFAEIHRGIELLGAGRKRATLDGWLTNDLPSRFDNRIISISKEIAEEWARLMTEAGRSGFGLDTFDGFIAASARVHSLTLVTRNTKDFSAIGLQLANPWLT